MKLPKYSFHHLSLGLESYSHIGKSRAFLSKAILLLLLGYNSYSQGLSTDFALADSTKLFKQIDRAIRYRSTNLDSCKLLADNALAKAVFSKYDKGIGKALKAKAVYFTVRGDFTKAMNTTVEAIPYSEKAQDWENVAWLYDGLSVVYRYRGNYDSAMYFTKESLVFFEKINDRKGIARSYNIIADTHEKMGHLFDALNYFDRSLKISEELQHDELMLYSYTQMVEIYLSQENFDKALQLAFQNMEANEKEKVPSKTSISRNYRMIASVYLEQKDYDKALHYSLKSLEVGRSIQHRVSIAENCARIASIYAIKGSPESALPYLEEGWKSAQRMKSDEAKANLLISFAKYYSLKNAPKEAYQSAKEAFGIASKIRNKLLLGESANQLAIAAAKLNKFEEAYNSHKIYKETTDSIQNLRINNKALAQEYDRKEERAKIEAEKKSITAQAELREQRLIRNVSLAGTGLMIVFIGFGYRAYVSQRKARMLQQYQKDELSVLNDQLSSKNDEIAAQSDKLAFSNQNLQRANLEINEKNQSLTDSINYAKRIQKALLPLPEKLEQVFGTDNAFVLYRPKDIVSGDFYWIEEVDDKIVLVVADCTGHGVPGAFMSTLGIDILQQIVKLFKMSTPQKILSEMHRMIREMLKQEFTDGSDGMDMAVLVIDKAQYQAHYAGAMIPLYYLQNDELHKIKATRRSVGGQQYEPNRKFKIHQIDLSVPTSLYLCTDGYQDQFGGKKKRKFMIGRLKSLLISMRGQRMSKQKEVMAAALEKWMFTGSEPQVDDITVVGVQM